MKRAGSVALCLLLVAVLFTGCIPDSREFTCQDLTMDIPLLMKDVSSDSAFSEFTFALDGNKVAIFGQREDFTDNKILSQTTPLAFANALIAGNGHNTYPATRTNDQYVYYIYKATVDGEELKYVAGVFKGSEAFWLVQFGGPAEGFDVDACLGYLDTVTVG